MPEKLALKTTLYEELHTTTKEIEELGKKEYPPKSIFDFDYSESVVDSIKIKYLSQHRDFILKLIAICVDRNKF